MAKPVAPTGGKALTKDEKAHKARLVELGCMYCRTVLFIFDTPPELHHYRGGGWGKGDYRTLIPLCPEHHRGMTGVHGLGTKRFDRESGTTQALLLEQTLELI